MVGMKVLLRILLSLSVFVAGFSHAMPAELIAPGADAAPIAHSHCKGHAAQALHGAAAHDGSHGSARHDDGKHHSKGGCCKSGGCPCPHVAAMLWDEGGAISPLGRHTSDFAPTLSDYRSPALERLIRPPIV